MKSIFNLLAALVFLISASAGAQESGAVKPSDTTYAVMYKNLRELYSKQQNSKSQQHAQQLRQEFITSARMSNKDYSQTKNMAEWLAENIKNTDFKSYDDALAKWKSVQQANTVATQDNAALYDYLKEAVKIHGPEIYAKVAGEVERARLLKSRTP